MGMNKYAPTALVAICVGLPLNAVCQVGGTVSTGTDSTANADDRIADIVVTAQRRSERLQDVPISVAAVDASLAEALGIQSTLDLPRVTPGLDIQLENGAAAPTLRGISTPNTVGDESPVAIYVDGVYEPALSGAVFALNNIDRIEVLKGPQGTLFGRNAAGGVIQVITRTPQQEPEADFSATYSNYDTISANAYLTGGLGPNVAADLAVYDSDQAGGWGHDLATGSDTYLTREFAARSKVLVDIDDQTQLTLIGSYDKSDSQPGTAQRIVPPYVPIYGPVQNFGFYNTSENLPGHFLSTESVISAKLTHDWDFARFVSQSSAQQANEHAYIDLDHTALDIIGVNPEQQDTRTYTQELQLLSADKSVVKWIGGLFYFYSVPSQLPLRLNGLGVAPFTEELINAVSHTKSYAAFGETTVPIADQTRLTVGVRYTADNRTIEYNTFLDTLAINAGSAHKDFDKITYRLTLDHNFAPDILVFGTVSRGFKSGLYQIAAPTTPVVAPETLDAYEIGIKSEFLDGHVRANASIFHYKFEDIQLQETVGTVTTLYNAAASRINGLDAEIVVIPLKGLRLQGSTEYLDTRFTDFPNAAFYIPNVDAAGVAIGGLTAAPGDATGYQMPRAPRWTASLSSQYSFPITVGTMQIAASYDFNSGYFWTPQNTFRQPKTNLLGASIKWSAPRDRWDVRVWGRNLANEQYYSYVDPLSFGYGGSAAAPRTYGLTVGAHF